jgi:hypothetical protein
MEPESMAMGEETLPDEEAMPADDPGLVIET